MKEPHDGTGRDEQMDLKEVGRHARNRWYRASRWRAHDGARDQWQRTMRDYPGTRSAALAGEALTRSPTSSAVPASVMPSWTEEFSTHGARAMTYGMRLHAHRLPLFTAKEMLKILADVYGKHNLGAQARFRAGVACQELGNPEAAVYQWQCCLRDAPDTPWAERSRSALIACGREPTPPDGPAPPAAKGGAGQRFRLAEELSQAGLQNEGQAILEYLKVLTVARPPADKLSPQSTAMLRRAQGQSAESLALAGRSPREIEQLIRSLPPLDPAKGVEHGGMQSGGTP